jgi:hypothetical protein
MSGRWARIGIREPPLFVTEPADAVVDSGATISTNPITQIAIGYWLL